MESSQVNLHKKEVGRLRNHDAFYQVSSLILKADKMPDERVQLLGMGAAIVPSQSKPGTSHSVTGANSDSMQPSCTCPAAQKDRQCWHIVKVLKLSGATAKSLLQCLGLFKGSSMGGYAQLYASMAAARDAALAAANQVLESLEAACSAGVDDTAALENAAPAEVEAAAAQIGGVDGGAQVSQPASTKAAVRVNSQRRSGYDKAMAAVSRLRSLGRDWERDSLDWDLLEHHALRAVHDVEKALAGRGALALTSDTARLLPNPAAPSHNSLERGKSWLEQVGQRSKKRKQDGSPVDARPEAFQLIPAQQRKGKERSVLEQIERRTGSSGGCTSAAAALAAAPHPPVSGARILAPLCPIAPLPAVDAALEAALGNTVPRVHPPGPPAPSLIQRAKRATQGLQPSRFRT